MLLQRLLLLLLLLMLLLLLLLLLLLSFSFSDTFRMGGIPFNMKIYDIVRRKSRNGNFIYLQLRPAAAIVVVVALLCCFVVPLFRVVCAVVLWVLWIPYFALF